MATLVITPEMERDLSTIADATGASLADELAVAIHERLERILPRRVAKSIDWTRVRALRRQVAEHVDLSKTDEDLVGYDEFGAPE